MALGELYKPTGLALEQAQAVLEIENPYAVNVTWGCEHGCLYCYGPLVGRQSRGSWTALRFPKEPPVELVGKQLEKGLIPEGVFISFETDPFLERNRKATEDLISLLLDHDVRVATSSKTGISKHHGVRHGMTIVSLDEGFCKRWEPNAPPPKVRIEKLKKASERGDFTWASLEPCPPPQIWEQDILELLEEIAFVDLIIKGRWQYNPNASTDEARIAYIKIFEEVAEFCKKHSIRFHPKSETLKWLKGG